MLFNLSLQKQCRSVCVLFLAGAITLIFRLQATTPQFSSADNPAARDPHFLTRLLTFAYLPVFNFGLLLYPNTLSFDWGMDAVPRVASLRDARNILTISFYATLGFLAKRCIERIRRRVGLEGTEEKVVVRRKICKDLAVVVDEKHVCACPVCHQSLSEVHSASCRTTNNNNSVSLHTTCVCARVSPKIFVRPRASSKNTNAGAVFLLALAFLTLPFLPATNLLFYVGFVVAERVLYLPSAGLCLLLGLGATKLWAIRRYRAPLVFCLFVLLLVFGARTVLRNRDWTNEEALYKAAIHVNPPKGEIYTCLRIGGLRSAYGIFMRPTTV